MPKCDFQTSAWVSPANLLHIFRTLFLDPMQDGLFCGCSRMAGGGGGAKRPPLPKICHTHTTMMKLGKLYLA